MLQKKALLTVFYIKYEISKQVVLLIICKKADNLPVHKCLMYFWRQATDGCTWSLNFHFRFARGRKSEFRLVAMRIEHKCAKHLVWGKNLLVVSEGFAFGICVSGLWVARMRIPAEIISEQISAEISLQISLWAWLVLLQLLGPSWLYFLWLLADHLVFVGWFVFEWRRKCKTMSAQDYEW